MDDSKHGLSRRELLQAAAAVSAVAMCSVPRRSSAATIPVPLETFAMQRLALGLRPSERDEWSQLAPQDEKRLAAWLERQLKPSTIDDRGCDEKIERLQLKTLHKSMAQLWADHVVAADKMRQEEKQTAMMDESAAKGEKKDENELRRRPAVETEIATWMRSVHSRRRLLEVMTGFWHDHFNIYAWEPKISPAFVHFDRDVIRKHAFGNFRALLEEVAKSPAMLLYLDNGINQSGNPNENYARELFELHTLGAENYLGTKDRGSVPLKDGVPIGYVDGDVYESARCFTGWRLQQGDKTKNNGEFEYFDQWHDRFQKVVFGKHLKEYQPPMKDGHDVLDLLANHPGTARFIARKLCRRFVADEPSEPLVEKVAKVFHNQRKSVDQMAHVLKTVVLSNEFKTSREQKITRPFEFIVASLRALNADFTPSDHFLRNFESTGQKLFSWRTPDGFPDRGGQWFGTNAFFERWHLLNHILLGEVDGVRIDEDVLGKPKDPGEFLTHLEVNVLQRSLSASSRSSLVAFLKKNEKRPRRFLLATGMALMSPEMQWS